MTSRNSTHYRSNSYFGTVITNKSKMFLQHLCYFSKLEHYLHKIAVFMISINTCKCWNKSSKTCQFLTVTEAMKLMTALQERCHLAANFLLPPASPAVHGIYTCTEFPAAVAQNIFLTENINIPWLKNLRRFAYYICAKPQLKLNTNTTATFQRPHILWDFCACI